MDIGEFCNKKEKDSDMLLDIKKDAEVKIIGEIVSDSYVEKMLDYASGEFPQSIMTHHLVHMKELIKVNTGTLQQECYLELLVHMSHQVVWLKRALEVKEKVLAHLSKQEELRQQYLSEKEV